MRSLCHICLSVLLDFFRVVFPIDTLEQVRWRTHHLIKLLEERDAIAKNLLGLLNNLNALCGRKECLGLDKVGLESSLYILAILLAIEVQEAETLVPASRSCLGGK